ILVESIEFPNKATIEALYQQFLSAKENYQNLRDSIATITYYSSIFKDLKETLIIYNNQVTEAEDEIKSLKAENKLFEKVLDEISKIKTRLESINESEKNANFAIVK